MPDAPELIAEYSAAVEALAGVSREVARYRAVGDAELLELARLGAEQRRLAQANESLVAGELAHRSRQELGTQGLARRTGHRTVEELVKVTTGATGPEAKTVVAVGKLVHEAASVVDASTGHVPTPARPWLRAVGLAVGGGLSLAAAEAIGRGLGAPSADIPASVLADAVDRLLLDANAVDADRLYQRARELRDELDEAGIADREAHKREQRSFRLQKMPDGMVRIVWLLAPEDGAVVTEIFDRITSPRRGGPRFVDPERATAARATIEDERSTEQLASDSFLELLRQGVDRDPSALLGGEPPAVRVAITERALRERSGHGCLESTSEPVSLGTAERLACAAGTVVLVFGDDRQPLKLGREQRLFTKTQRIALAVRDGGCRWPGCNRPPSWSEAHHVRHWKRDSGCTDIEDGILLCRHHHFLLHNNGWEIERRASEYWLRPPADIDPRRAPRSMPSRSPVLRELFARAG